MITIKEYENGQSFLDENKRFLDTNKYMAVFFYLDAEVLYKIDINNYAIKVEENGEKLLAMRLEPYNLLLFGNELYLKYLLDYLDNKKYKIDGIMCSTDIGNYLLYLNNNYHQTIGMDFMEAKTITIASSSDVVIPKEEDIDEIYNMSCEMFKECGLSDVVNKDKIKNNISNFRMIKINDEIVGIASYGTDTDNSKRISHVYTKPKYRGKGYAKKIVNTIKNIIINSGFIATLNVDQLNPISNHIYTSLGFKKVFSQGIYKIKER